MAEEVGSDDNLVLQFKQVGEIANVGQKSGGDEDLTSCLLLSSSRYGFTIIAKSDCLLYIKTNTLMDQIVDNRMDTSAFIKIRTPAQPLQQICLSSDDLQVAAVAESDLIIFDVRTIAELKPPRSHSLDSDILDVKWSPSDPNLLLLLTQNELHKGTIGSSDIMTSSLFAGDVCSVCWDPSGNKIAMGFQNGTIEIRDSTGKNTLRKIQSPDEECSHPEQLVWINNHLIACYAKKEEGERHTLYFFHSEDQSVPARCWSLFQDGTPDCRYFLQFLPEWKTLIATCSNSTEAEVLSLEASEVKVLYLDDSKKLGLPLDSYPRGMSLDLSNPRAVPIRPRGDEESVPSYRTPVLFVLTNEGTLVAYYYLRSDADKPHAFMMDAQPIPAAASKGASLTSAPAPSTFSLPASQGGSTPLFPPSTSLPGKTSTAPNSSTPITASPPFSWKASDKPFTFEQPKNTATPSFPSAPKASTMPTFNFSATKSAGAPASTFPTAPKATTPTFDFKVGESSSTKPFDFGGTTPSFNLGSTFPKEPKETNESKKISKAPTVPPTGSVFPSAPSQSNTPTFVFPPNPSKTTLPNTTPTFTKNTTAPVASKSVAKTATNPTRTPNVGAPITVVDSSSAFPNVPTPAGAPKFTASTPSSGKNAGTPAAPVISPIPSRRVSKLEVPTSVPTDLASQIQDQISRFDTTLDQLRSMSHNLQVQLDDISNSRNPKFSMDSLRKLAAKISLVEDTVSQCSHNVSNSKKKMEAASVLRIDLLRQEAYACEILENKRDPDYNLIRNSRKLDPWAANVQVEIRKKYAALEQSVTEVEIQLKHMYREHDQKRSRKAPMVDSIYRILKNNIKTVSNQSQDIDKLESQLENLKLKSQQPRRLKTGEKEYSIGAFPIAPNTPLSTRAEEREVKADRVLKLKSVLLAKPPKLVMGSGPSWEPSEEEEYSLDRIQELLKDQPSVKFHRNSVTAASKSGFAPRGTTQRVDQVKSRQEHDREISSNIKRNLSPSPAQSPTPLSSTPFSSTPSFPSFPTTTFNFAPPPASTSISKFTISQDESDEEEGEEFFPEEGEEGEEGYDDDDDYEEEDRGPAFPASPGPHRPLFQHQMPPSPSLGLDTGGSFLGNDYSLSSGISVVDTSASFASPIAKNDKTTTLGRSSLSKNLFGSPSPVSSPSTSVGSPVTPPVASPSFSFNLDKKMAPAAFPAADTKKIDFKLNLDNSELPRKSERTIDFAEISASVKSEVKATPTPAAPSTFSPIASTSKPTPSFDTKADPPKAETKPDVKFSFAVPSGDKDKPAFGLDLNKADSKIEVVSPPKSDSSKFSFALAEPAKTTTSPAFPATPAVASTPAAPAAPSSVFGSALSSGSGSVFGSTSTPAFGSTSFGSSTVTTPTPTPAPTAASTASTGSTPAPAFPPASPSRPAFGATSFETPSFGGLGLGSSTPSAPKNPFGGPLPAAAPAAATPAFGSTSFGSSTPAPASSVFGSTPTSTFGGAAATGVFSTPTFGSTGFGTPAATPAAPTSVFGSTPAAAPAATSVFGSTTTTNPTSVFGSASSGTSAFGASATPAFPPASPSRPAFGATSFGQPAASTFGSPSFGTSSFGQPAAAPAFGQSAFGSTPAAPGAAPTRVFGSGAPPSTGFGGAPSGGSAFGAAATSGGSAFGSLTPLGAASGFGSTSTFGGAPAFGQPAFGQTAQPAPAFGQSAFGSAPASPFGAGTSAFGQAPASPSPFGGAAAAPASMWAPRG